VPPKLEGSDRTVAIQKRALPLEEALARICRNDPRPLLVLRECVRCTGTEDALLMRMADNERTFLLSRWFHCVKLPPAVLEPDHPFHALFPGEKPAHVFVSRADGSLRHDLVGTYSQVELWTAMKRVLASEYRDDPDRALGKLSRILLAGLRRDLSELCAKRNELREEVTSVSKLAPLQPEPRVKKAG
jgi:hypothetical protein